jgi:hypothetical protein
MLRSSPTDHPLTRCSTHTHAHICICVHTFRSINDPDRPQLPQTLHWSLQHVCGSFPCTFTEVRVCACAGLTPVAAGQWPSFLARITGLLALQHLLRPLRFSCAMALTPVVDRMMGMLQRRLGVDKKGSFALMFVLLAAVTLSAFGVALTTATLASMPAAGAI